MIANPANAAETVWIIDSSALIQTKRAIAAHCQWSFLERLKLMVDAGQVCFPKAVRNELQVARHVDTPEAWALDVCSLVQHSYEPQDQTVAEVMAAAGAVVDADAEGDPADPYVLAQALEIQRVGREVCVVTNDLVDRMPIKISMLTACGVVSCTYLVWTYWTS